jgi:hypothetical protein
MTGYNLQKPLQPISTLFNHFVRKPIRKDLKRQLVMMGDKNLS